MEVHQSIFYRRLFWRFGDKGYTLLTKMIWRLQCHLLRLFAYAVRWFGGSDCSTCRAHLSINRERGGDR